MVLQRISYLVIFIVSECKGTLKVLNQCKCEKKQYYNQIRKENMHETTQHQNVHICMVITIIKNSFNYQNYYFIFYSFIYFYFYFFYFSDIQKHKVLIFNAY